MDETPRKVIRSEYFCFLCSCNLGKDQVCVSRKSAVDIARLIKRALQVDVSLHSSVGEKGMRDKRTPKDVCGEANFSMELIKDVSSTKFNK